MKILLISWYFPPVNDVAALRTGALADFLHKRGHEVYVLTAARNSSDKSLTIPLPPKQIIRTDWFNIDRLRVERSSASRSATPVGPPHATSVGQVRSLARLRAFATGLYTDIVHIPDRQVGWLPYALSAGRDLVRHQHIELIYASGPSFVSFMVANSLSRQFDVPWIAEYRDGWSGDIYKPRAKWRETVDRMLENWTLRSATEIVAVSAPWADYFRKRFAKPTVAIYNGFDVEPEATTVGPLPTAGAPLSIVYFGQLYDGLRDPSALYEAIVRSGLTPRDVQVVYYGPADKHVRPLVEKLGVSAHVSVRPRVGHANRSGFSTRVMSFFCCRLPMIRETSQRSSSNISRRAGPFWGSGSMPGCLRN